MTRRPSGRPPVHPRELAFAAVVAAYCMLGNVVAAAYVEPFSRHNTGPLALAYHDKRPPLIYLSLLLLLLLASAALPPPARVALVAFVGAACANVASALLWPSGVPDYIVFRHIDVIANLPDIVMVVAGTILFASMLARILTRARATGHGPGDGQKPSRRLS